jgi:hypothetical protein
MLGIASLPTRSMTIDAMHAAGAMTTYSIAPRARTRVAAVRSSSSRARIAR